MGSGPVDGVADPGWFEFYDDTIEVDPSSVADRAFLAGLRARAVSHAWPCDPDDTWTYHAIDDDQHLLRVGVWLHVWLRGRTNRGAGKAGDVTQARSLKIT
jgi:hypothetical protein